MSLNTDPIPFSRPDFGPEEEAAALRVLRSGWLTTGPECEAFEEEFAAAIANLSGTPKAPFALAVNSATSGLHLALLSLGIGPGSRVALPTYTFVATAEAVLYTGAEPVLLDIAPGTLHLDPELLEQELERARRVAQPIAAVISVHIGGTSHKSARIRELCQHYGAGLIEDAAHCFPSTNGRVAHGDDSDLGVFSFYANKNLATGEGGMLITRSEERYRAMKIRRLHGIDRDVWNRYRDPAAARRYDVVELGYKYNLTDLAAAIGRVQLARATRLHEARSRIAARYFAALGELPWLELPFLGDGTANAPVEAHASHAWHLFVVRLRCELLGHDRDAFATKLHERGIATSQHFVPLHRMSYYGQVLGLARGSFAQSNAAADSVLSLPLFPSMSNSQTDRVIEELVQIGDTWYREYGQVKIDTKHPKR